MAEARGGPVSCRGCDEPAQVNDLGLCDTCVEKLERDLIRARDWECSMTVYGMSREAREATRREIIAEHGREMELLAEEAPSDRKKKPKRSRKKPPRRR